MSKFAKVENINANSVTDVFIGVWNTFIGKYQTYPLDFTEAAKEEEEEDDGKNQGLPTYALVIIIICCVIVALAAIFVVLWITFLKEKL